MDALLITDFVAPIIVGIILIFFGLIIEYRTGFFVKHIENLKSSDRDGKSKNVKQSLFSTNWAETTKQARINLANIHGVRPNEIYIVRWHVDRLFRELKIEFKLPQDIADEMGLLDWNPDPSDPHAYATANRKGRIKNVSYF